MNTAYAIQSILFATGEPHTVTSLAKVLGIDTDAVTAAIAELKNAIKEHGVILVELDGTVALATAPTYSTLIETIRKEELSKELSKASAETLAIVTYNPGATKSQIEFIRGVNASYSVRALQMRGLIEQRGIGRGVGYWPTLRVLEHFGVARIEDLPEYATSNQTLTELLAREITQS